MSLLLVLLLVHWESVSAASLGGGAQEIQAATPSPPKWPDSYIVEFVVTMPQMYLMQPQRFSIPTKAWYDGPKGMSRVEMFSGVDTVLTVDSVEYDIHPRIQQEKCYKADQHATAKPVLPDISDWVFAGDLTLDGVPSHLWRTQSKDGDLISTYTFYTSLQGAPLRLHMFGRNVIEDSHYDEYIYEFKSFQVKASGSHGEVFLLPNLCSAPLVVEGQGARWLSMQVDAVLPGARAGALPSSDSALAAAYAHWSLQHGRPASALDSQVLSQRLERFRQNAEMVAAHNADPSKTYTMHLGRFADWTREEYLGVLLPDALRREKSLPSLRQQRREEAVKKVPHALDPIGTFKRQMRNENLPKKVDWRGTLVDTGIKDQGFCGSCWSFAATGAMEAAWYLATGESLSFSQQQIVDCSYDYGVDGCDGGDASAAINYVAQNGGIALGEAYNYIGADDFCKASNFSRVGQFAGYLKVKARDEQALMEAVYTMGPVAVALDASLDGFGFYKEGVYSDPSCSNYDLDHAVLLVGYGTTEDGVDYWLIKNSWGKLFGEDGYIKIVRGSNDCGISTDTAIAVVEESARRR